VGRFSWDLQAAFPLHFPDFDPQERVYDGKEGKKMATATLDWSQCPAVESIPGKVSGAWVFKNTRMPVSTVFENLEAGATIEEIMEWFHLTRDPIVTVLEFAARSLEDDKLPLTATQRAELDRRLQTLDQDRREGITWAALKAELEQRCP
jgi:putative addiction module component (TIGR02574 family)